MGVVLSKETNLYDNDAIADGISGAISAYDATQNQTAIFNKLTNNGVAQGIFMVNGQLYINMSYLQTGILKLGGVNNIDGQMEVYDASGTKIGYFDRTGLMAKSLIADEYIFVDGSQGSSIKIPYFAGSWGGYSIFNRHGFLGVIDGKSPQYCRIGLIPASESTPDQVYATNVFTVGNTQYYSRDASHREILITPYRIGMSGGNSYYWMLTDSDANFYVNLFCTGTKSRVVNTKDYGERLLYCYETPSPLFGDVGEGTISDDGKCYVQIDSIFSETVTLSQYQIFLQKYGNGDCWVSEKTPAYFVVEGTPGLPFGWELKAKQSDFDQYRLEKKLSTEVPQGIDYGEMAANHISGLKEERRIA